MAARLTVMTGKSGRNFSAAAGGRAGRGTSC
jgi:hypothetical protein